MARGTREVLDDHLALADRGELETDIARNFDPGCVLLTSFGVFRGHAGVRRAAALLAHQLPQGHFTYRARLCHGELAFLQWDGDAAQGQVRDGADSFLIRDGRIHTMSIHYSVQPRRPS